MTSAPDRFPLTAMQSGFLLRSLEQPGAGSEVFQILFELDEELDTRSFRHAWERVVEHHPALRTTFDWEGHDEPVQCLHATGRVLIETHDWRARSAEEQERDFDQHLPACRARPFDLTTLPLMRTELFRLGDRRWRFAWTVHHALLDGASVVAVVRDVFAVHDALCTGGRVRLPPAPDLREYVTWLRSAERPGSEPFWAEQLRGLDPRSTLDGLGPVGEQRTPAGWYERSVSWSAEDTARLSRVAAETSASISAFLQCAWAHVLGRYGGQRDVVFGVTRACRHNAPMETRAISGLLLNTLPVRTRIRADRSVADWSADVRRLHLDLRRHEHDPLDRIRAWGGLPAGSALFETAVLFENQPTARLLEAAIGAVPGRRCWTVSQTSHRIALHALLDGGLTLKLAAYHGECPAPILGGMLELCSETLASMARDPGQRVSSLPSVSRGDRRWLAEQDRPPPDAAAPGFLEAFAAQLGRSPDAVAVTDPEGALTYAELARRARWLSGQLTRRGVRPGDTVAVCMPRCQELLVALLGTLGCGAACVPIDVSHPAPRRRFVIADSGSRVCLTVGGEAPDGVESVDVRQLLRVMPAGTTLRRAAPLPPDSLAYVLYTSGSTGEPKGVMVSHASLATYLDWCVRSYDLSPGSAVPAFTSIGFDATLTSLFAPLVSGARVVMLPEDDELEELARLLAREPHVGLVKLTPTHLELLEDVLADAAAPPLPRRLILGGEALRSATLAAWQDRGGNTRFVNEYGPTETTVGCCTLEFTDCASWGTDVPIGRPTTGASIQLLDPGMTPVPVGMVGEIAIGGRGVARGYLGRPGLTAERFRPDASRSGGARLYLSGDLGRWDRTGLLEYRGRMDHQVKIRGHRVELGEVEASLLGLPAVREAVAVTRNDSGRTRLAAFVTLTPGARCAGEALQGQLHERVPAHLVPSTIEVLDGLPLTANGKLDRQTLSARASAAGAPGRASHVPPRTVREAQLAAIWEDVLGVERIGIRSSFFELGGDSIHALSIVARASRCGLRLTPRLIFRHRTIEALAEAADGPAAVVEAAVVGDVPLTPVQHWFLSLGWDAPDHYNMALLVPVEGSLTSDTASRVLDGLVAHHDALRCGFRNTPAGWVQTCVADPSPVACAHFDLASLPAAEQARRLEELAGTLQRGMQLDRPPLLRAALLHLGEGGHGLLLVVHHLVMDYVSLDIVLEDFRVGCARLAAGESLAPPVRTASIRTWASRLQECAGTAWLEEQSAHWASRSRPVDASLPTDGPLPAHGDLVADVTRQSVSLEPAEVTALRRLPAGVLAALLSGLGRAVAAWTGGQPVFVALERHGREDHFPGVDVSRTVGWFTSFAPLRLDVREDEPAGDSLATIVGELERAPAHGLGFGIWRHLQGGRRAADFVEPQISFNFLGGGSGQDAPALLGDAAEQLGALRSPAGRRPHLLEVDAQVVDGRLVLRVSHNHRIHTRPTITRLLERTLEELRLIASSAAPTTQGPAPARGFPASGLDAHELDELLSEFDDEG